MSRINTPIGAWGWSLRPRIT